MTSIYLRQYAKSGSKSLATRGYTSKKSRSIWLVTGATIVFICALLIWITLEVCGSTQVIRAEGSRLPSNTVDMRGTFSANAQVVPPIRG